MNMPAPNALDSSAFRRDTLTRVVSGYQHFMAFFASPCHEITDFRHRTDLRRSTLKRATSRGNSSFARQGEPVLSYILVFVRHTTMLST